jgi:hypothetical protein
MSRAAAAAAAAATDGGGGELAVEREDLRLHEVKQVSRPAAALLRWVLEVVRWVNRIHQVQRRQRRDA